MAYVEVGKNENLDSALRRFSKKVDEERIIKEFRERRYFVKPSKVRREKKKEAIRRQELKKLKNHNKFDRG